MDTITIITISIAIYGAILSTIIAIRQFRRDRIIIQVNCEPCTNIGLFLENNKGIEILAANEGFRAVEIRYAGFMMSNKKKYITMVGTNPLPKKLSEGESVPIAFDLEEVKLALEPFGGNVKYKYPFVETSNGKIIKGKLPEIFTDLKLT